MADLDYNLLALATSPPAAAARIMVYPQAGFSPPGTQADTAATTADSNQPYPVSLTQLGQTLSGLVTAETDTTLTGTGASGAPLSVANPFTPTDEAKLDGIQAGAQVNPVQATSAAAGILELATNAEAVNGVDSTRAMSPITTRQAIDGRVTGARLVSLLAALTGGARLPASAIRDLPTGGGGATTFLGLTDTPTTFTPNATLRVNSQGNQIVFDSTERNENFLDLNDTPAAYTGQGGNIIAVNAGATALGFIGAAGLVTLLSSLTGAARLDATAIKNLPTGGGGGVTGIESVASDGTLTGSGTTGSPLSVANPFTATDESKLDGIAAGAEVNVQADWNAVSGDAFILNKPSLVTSFTGLTDTPSALGLAGNLLAVNPAGNGLVFVAPRTISTDSTVSGDGTVADPYSVANPFTAADELKLDGIAAGAEVNVQPDWNAASGDAEILNKPAIPAVETGASLVAKLVALSGNLRLPATAIRDLPTGGGGGATTFAALTDTPSGLGAAGQYLAVNTGATALEFVDAPAGGGGSRVVGNNLLQANVRLGRGVSDSARLNYTNIDLGIRLEYNKLYYVEFAFTAVSGTPASNADRSPEIFYYQEGVAVDFNDTIELTGDDHSRNRLNFSNPVSGNTTVTGDSNGLSRDYYIEIATIREIAGGAAGGGLSVVESDATLSGTGAAGSPLSVANPFTAADEAKLDGIQAGAQINPEGTDIVSLLSGLSGSARLPASAIRDLPATSTGLATVSTTTTLQGDGTVTNPLRIATPYTSAEQTKLAGIAAGAEVNVQADWNAASGDAAILNKPAIPAAETGASLVAKLSALTGGAQLPATAIRDLSVGATAFTGLTDTPAGLGTAGQYLAVNTGATGLEFVNAPAGGGGAIEPTNIMPAPVRATSVSTLAGAADLGVRLEPGRLYIIDIATSAGTEGGLAGREFDPQAFIAPPVGIGWQPEGVVGRSGSGAAANGVTFYTPTSGNTRAHSLQQWWVQRIYEVDGGGSAIDTTLFATLANFEEEVGEKHTYTGLGAPGAPRALPAAGGDTAFFIEQIKAGAGRVKYIATLRYEVTAFSRDRTLPLVTNSAVEVRDTATASTYQTRATNHQFNVTGDPNDPSGVYVHLTGELPQVTTLTNALHVRVALAITPTDVHVDGGVVQQITLYTDGDLDEHYEHIVDQKVREGTQNLVSDVRVSGSDLEITYGNGQIVDRALPSSSGGASGQVGGGAGNNPVADETIGEEHLTDRLKVLALPEYEINPSFGLECLIGGTFAGREMENEIPYSALNPVLADANIVLPSIYQRAATETVYNRAIEFSQNPDIADDPDDPRGIKIDGLSDMDFTDTMLIYMSLLPANLTAERTLIQFGTGAGRVTLRLQTDGDLRVYQGNIAVGTHQEANLAAGTVSKIGLHIIRNSTTSFHFRIFALGASSVEKTTALAAGFDSTELVVGIDSTLTNATARRNSSVRGLMFDLAIIRNPGPYVAAMAAGTAGAVATHAGRNNPYGDGAYTVGLTKGNASYQILPGDSFNGVALRVDEVIPLAIPLGNNGVDLNNLYGFEMKFSIDGREFIQFVPTELLPRRTSGFFSSGSDTAILNHHSIGFMSVFNLASGGVFASNNAWGMSFGVDASNNALATTLYVWTVQVVNAVVNQVESLKPIYRKRSA